MEDSILISRRKGIKNFEKSRPFFFFVQRALLRFFKCLCAKKLNTKFFSEIFFSPLIVRKKIR
ncbi:MAG: hypothetical protein IJ894_06330, partial [Bacteroidales bacterium]|nr:hypothetical protein [Bacteroidales bacterium]